MAKNSATLVGHLGKDPEIRDVGSGKVCNFSMATSESYTDRNNERKTSTEWHYIVVWGNNAQACFDNLSKGSLVVVTGKITSREYEDKSGITKRVTEIKARDVDFLSGGKNTEKKAPAPAANNNTDIVSGGDDDLPF